MTQAILAQRSLAKPANSVPAAELSTKRTLQLILGIGSLIVCFAAVGSLAAMMPMLSERLGLTEAQVGITLAIPLLVGSIGRLVVGLSTDRFGGRAVQIALIAFAIVPTTLAGYIHSYIDLLACAFFLGVPLAVYPAGVAFVSQWFPPKRQGTALGLLGLGNLGQSLSLFGAPAFVAGFGYRWGFQVFAFLAAAWLALFVLLGRDHPRRRRGGATLYDLLRPLACRESWILSFYYFLSFGSLLAMMAYLPRFLTQSFHLSKTDAGMRAAGFVVLATFMRPVGGWLADRTGSRPVLLGTFISMAAMALFMTSASIAVFTIGALGMALAAGLANGAVFKLVPQWFPDSVGSVTGLVAAAGGLGGFFPPMLLGVIHQATGSFSLGFVGLSSFSLGALVLCLLAQHRSFAASNIQ